jgi:serine/threonine protein kinase
LLRSGRLALSRQDAADTGGGVAGVTPIFDRGETEDGTYYIAMEYLPGGTLKDRIRSKGALSPHALAEVALQSAEALQAAHDKGIIHRDVKPDNILIAGSGHVKVADFGIARAVDATTISHLGDILGSAKYMSPEQAVGEKVDPRVTCTRWESSSTRCLPEGCHLRATPRRTYPPSTRRRRRPIRGR